MQGDEYRVAALHVTTEPFDRVGVEIGRVHLDGRGKVEDQGPLGRGLDHVGDRVAHLERVFEFSTGETLRRVLVDEIGVGRRRLQALAQRGGVDGDLLHIFHVHAKDHAPLQRRSRL